MNRILSREPAGGAEKKESRAGGDKQKEKKLCLARTRGINTRLFNQTFFSQFLVVCKGEIFFIMIEFC